MAHRGFRLSADTPLADRLLFYVAVDLKTRCWNWLGGLCDQGYPRITFQYTTLRAHRASYEVFAGPIPVGLELDHLCRNPRCINPEHLEPVTSRVNTLRGVSPAAVNARKIECPRGHDYSLHGRRSAQGRRYCRACDRERRADARKSAKSGRAA